MEEGAIVGQANGRNVFVSYIGGDGNDVVLVVEGSITLDVDARSANTSLLEVVNGYLELSTDGGSAQRRLLVATTDLTVNGSTFDDILIADDTAIEQDLLVTINGGQGTNELHTEPGDVESIEHDLSGADNGVIRTTRTSGVGGFEITYAEFQTVELLPTSVAELTFTVDQDSESILSDDSDARDGIAQFESADQQFATTRFTNPATALTILADNGSISVAQMDNDASPMTSDLRINRVSGSSTGAAVAFAADKTLNGDVHIAAASVELNAALTADNIGWVVTGSVVLRGSATANTGLSIDAEAVTDESGDSSPAIRSPVLAIRANSGIGTLDNPVSTQGPTDARRRNRRRSHRHLEHASRSSGFLCGGGGGPRHNGSTDDGVLESASRRG